MQIQQHENGEDRSLVLSIKELISLKSQIDLDKTDLTNEPEWNDSQRAEYILTRILDYPPMKENRILLHPTKPIEEYDQTHIYNAHYIAGKTGRKELIAFFKYLGLSPYEDKQFSLSQAIKTALGCGILKELQSGSTPCGKKGDPFLANELSKDYFILNKKFGLYAQFLKIEIELTIQNPYTAQESGVML